MKTRRIIAWHGMERRGFSIENRLLCVLVSATACAQSIFAFGWPPKRGWRSLHKARNRTGQAVVPLGKTVLSDGSKPAGRAARPLLEQMPRCHGLPLCASGRF